jgi:hypothetical protein
MALTKRRQPRGVIKSRRVKKVRRSIKGKRLSKIKSRKQGKTRRIKKGGQGEIDQRTASKIMSIKPHNRTDAQNQLLEDYHNKRRNTENNRRMNYEAREEYDNPPELTDV